MDALSDPRAFLSAQDKRAQQLAALGIQESDIGTDIIEGLPKVNVKQASASDQTIRASHQYKHLILKQASASYQTI